MSSVLINHKTALVRQLDKPSQPDEVVKAEDVQDPGMLARILRRLLVDVAEMKRRFVPRSITFVDVVSTGSSGAPARVTLVHGFGGLVHWVTVRTIIASGNVPLMSEVTNDGEKLVLDVYYAGTFAIEVRERG